MLDIQVTGVLQMRTINAERSTLILNQIPEVRAEGQLFSGEISAKIATVAH